MNKLDVDLCPTVRYRYCQQYRTIPHSTIAVPGTVVRRKGCGTVRRSLRTGIQSRYSSSIVQLLYIYYILYSKSNTVQSTRQVMPVPGNVLRAAILFAKDEGAKLLQRTVHSIFKLLAVKTSILPVCRRKNPKKLPCQRQRRGSNSSSSFVTVIALTMPIPRYVCSRKRPTSLQCRA